jgi:hypothetical protein
VGFEKGQGRWMGRRRLLLLFDGGGGVSTALYFLCFSYLQAFFVVFQSCMPLAGTLKKVLSKSGQLFAAS